MACLYPIFVLKKSIQSHLHMKCVCCSLLVTKSILLTLLFACKTKLTAEIRVHIFVKKRKKASKYNSRYVCGDTVTWRNVL